MSKNKRPPKEIQKYVVVQIEKTKESLTETYHYGRTQKEVKEKVNGKPGKKMLFKIVYDYLGEL